MASQIEISNAALFQLGANTITSLADTSQEALAINTWWAVSRRALLRLHPWNFAVKRQQLAQEVSTPLWEYDYKYTLPSDFIRLMEVKDDRDYKLEAGQILTNRTTCQIKYIFDVTDTTKWDGLFTDLMIARLAVDIAYAVTQDNGKRAEAVSLYREAQRVARAVDGQEDISDQIAPDDNSLKSVRY